MPWIEAGFIFQSIQTCGNQRVFLQTQNFEFMGEKFTPIAIHISNGTASILIDQSSPATTIKKRGKEKERKRENEGQREREWEREKKERAGQKRGLVTKNAVPPRAGF
jgi:hypothetical protein